MYFSTSATPAAALKNVSSQNFAFKLPIINYILDQTSSKILSKLYKTCKYFYLKKRLIIVEKFNFTDYSISLVMNFWANVYSSEKYFFLNNTSNLWITNEIRCFSKEPKLLSKIATTISKCNIQRLHIEYPQLLSWKEFEFLAKNVKRLHIKNLEIIECKNHVPFLEEILSRAPNVTYVRIFPSNTTSETSEKLLQIQRNEKFHSINFYPLNGPLNDARKFYQFLLKFAAPKAYVCVSDITEEFKNELETMVSMWEPADEIPLLNLFL